MLGLVLGLGLRLREEVRKIVIGGSRSAYSGGVVKDAVMVLTTHKDYLDAATGASTGPRTRSVEKQGVWYRVLRRPRIAYEYRVRIVVMVMAIVCARVHKRQRSVCVAECRERGCSFDLAPRSLLSVRLMKERGGKEAKGCISNRSKEEHRNQRTRAQARDQSS